MDAAIEAGVDRVLQESVSMLYPDRGSEWIDESVPTDRYPMARGNLAAEPNAHRFSDAGGTAIVLRFGWFYGPGATHSGTTARPGPPSRLHPDGLCRRLRVIDPCGRRGRSGSAALHAPAGTFNVVDDEPLTKREYAEALARAARARAWVRAPGPAALLLGDRSTSLTRSLRVSNQKLRTSTGWAPRYPSARNGLMATAAALS